MSQPDTNPSGIRIKAFGGISVASPGRPERPIATATEDVLGRTAFVRRLNHALINAATRRSTGVVIGLAGRWGSGKSSILNLLEGDIKETYPGALVVRFNPWIVSGRNDLITEFIRELIAAIKSEPAVAAQSKSTIRTLSDYGDHLAPVVGMVKPAGGAMLKGVLGAAKSRLAGEESLNDLRARLSAELEKAPVPIVALIDEIDRVEDDEVRTVAQLVRSVADFPALSYVLAYDPERIVQALGANAPDDRRDERGHAYLEKIVQLQIPLPETLSEEIARLLLAELAVLKSEIHIPENFHSIVRFRDLLAILTEDVITTPREIKRLIGTFHALAGMLAGEVDWIDLLAYSALLVKSPATVERMKREPDEFLENAITRRGMRRRILDEKRSIDERLADIVPASELNVGTKRVLSFMFPALAADSVDRQDAHADAISLRRPFLTTLRLGLLPGAYSREQIRKFVNQQPDVIQRELRTALRDDTLQQLLDRLDELYDELTDAEHATFWSGVARFLRKPDCEWMSSYQPMSDVVRSFAEMLERAVRRTPVMAEVARSVFSNLREQGDTELIAAWLRSHLVAHGLFGNKKGTITSAFLSADQTETLANKMAHDWRTEHLSGRLIPCRWTLDTVFTMLDTDTWDDLCREALDATLGNDDAVVGLTLMLFGGAYATGGEAIEKMCSYEKYLERVDGLLAGKSAVLDDTVKIAMRKALRRR
jgi:predicted KAP-like P-loop ATPase